MGAKKEGELFFLSLLLWYVYTQGCRCRCRQTMCVDTNAQLWIGSGRPRTGRNTTTSNIGCRRCGLWRTVVLSCRVSQKNVNVSYIFCDLVCFWHPTTKHWKKSGAGDGGIRNSVPTVFFFGVSAAIPYHTIPKHCTYCPPIAEVHNPVCQAFSCYISL